MTLTAQLEHEGFAPIQVIVHSGGPLVPYRPATLKDLFY